MKHLLITLCMAATLTIACNTAGSEGDISQAATEWAEAYFNYDLKSAQRLTTEEDGKWLEFRASNIAQADIDDVNRQEPAAVEHVAVAQGNDTTAMAWLTMSNVWISDSIEGGGHLEEEGVYVLNLVKRKGRWMVRMAGLPQSEKQNPD